jgi:peptidylprolyl isomerase
MAAEAGQTVKVHYTGTLEDGTMFDSSEGRDPLQFTVGGGQVIPGFDAGVTGLKVGESRTVTIPPEEAYGPVNDQLKLEFPIDQVPEGVDTTVGAALEITHESGQQIPVVVTEVTEELIILDANHPLAGKTLTFEIELVEIVGN